MPLDILVLGKLWQSALPYHSSLGGRAPSQRTIADISTAFAFPLICFLLLHPEKFFALQLFPV